MLLAIVESTLVFCPRGIPYFFDDCESKLDGNTLWSLAARVRSESPLVQCITNFVSMDVCANVLLAIGASPAMVHDPEEAGDFAALGGGLSINIGTPSPRWVNGMHAAARVARKKSTPWVLDPVAVGATAYRNDTVSSLLVHHPAMIRGNAGEIMALAGLEKVEVTSPDSSRASSEARPAAVALARAQKATVVVTGAEDLVTNGKRLFLCANGHPLMTRVTALGCALTGVCAAYLKIADDPVAAGLGALAYFGVCGEIAAEKSDGPGSLRVQLLDVLHGLDQSTFLSRIKIQEGTVP